jgi:hypothetical protein
MSISFHKIKCRLCHTIMQSKDSDVVICRCGEITLDGIDKKIYINKDISSYMEIDESGNEITSITKPGNIVSPEKPKPTKEELLAIFDDSIKAIEALPPQALNISVSQYDLYLVMCTISAIFKA